MTVEETVGHATEHGGEFDMAEMLSHHMVNSQELELPFRDALHLPTLQVFGYELPVTKHAVMMWVASAIAVLILVLIAARSNRRVGGSPAANAQGPGTDHQTVPAQDLCGPAAPMGQPSASTGRREHPPGPTAAW